MNTATALPEQGSPAPASTSPPVAPPVEAATPPATPPTATPVVAPAAAPVSAPAPVDITLTVPAGVTVDSALVDRVKSLAKSSGMTPAHAQAVLDSELSQQRQRDADFAHAVTTVWPEQIKSDPELGGANYARTVARADAVLAALSTAIPGLKEFASGPHARAPDVMRVWNWIGEQMGDSKLVTNGQPLGKTVSMGKRFFPNSPEFWTPEERAAEPVAGAK